MKIKKRIKSIGRYFASARKLELILSQLYSFLPVRSLQSQSSFSLFKKAKQSSFYFLPSAKTLPKKAASPFGLF